MGREAIQIPGVQPPNTTGFPRQLAAFVYDGGQTFGYATVLDAYTGKQSDGGYSGRCCCPAGKYM